MVSYNEWGEWANFQQVSIRHTQSTNILQYINAGKVTPNFEQDSILFWIYQSSSKCYNQTGLINEKETEKHSWLKAMQIKHEKHKPIEIKKYRSWLYAMQIKHE